MLLRALIESLGYLWLKEHDTVNSTAKLSKRRHLTNLSMIPESGIMEQQHQRHGIMESAQLLLSTYKVSQRNLPLERHTRNPVVGKAALSWPLTTCTTISNYWTRLSKISWFVSGEQINYLPKPKAEANNWSARHWQITIFCDNRVQ